VQELTGVERQNSRGSVNFSYPTGFREMAPYGQRQLTSPTPSSANQRTAPGQKQNLVYDPNTRTFMPEAELLFIEQSIQDAAERPVKRKKKVAPKSATGTHLAEGTVGGRIQGTAVNATNTADNKSKHAEEPQISPQPANITAPRKKKKKPSISDTSHEVESQTPSVSDYDSDNSEKPIKFNSRTGMLLAKKPSIVREDREGEEAEAEDDSNKASERQAALKKLESRSLDARPVSPTLISKPIAPMGHGRGLASVSTATAQTQQQTRTVSQPAPTFSTETTATSTVDTADDNSGTTKSARVQSLSPVRNAHFLTTPESLAVRHQPPARSISPRKSALKHSPSSRGSSPNGEAPVGSTTNRVSSLSETSDTSTAMSDERTLPKKKSVRVSFDDDSNVVLGQADTPVTSDALVLQSPQGKRGWFSGMGRGRKKDLADMDDSDDEIMKPRPALPSFGSVREKKSRDAEERPLVKPTESSEPAVPLPSPLFTTATGEAIQHPLGQSSDHAVGAVLVHDQVSKNAANISKSREPLPPEVTSVEGSGYISDSGSSIGTTEYVVDNSDTIHQKSEVQQVPETEEKLEDSHGDLSESSTQSSSSPSLEVPEIPSAKSKGNGTIPSLALTRASPTIEETGKESQVPYIIGGFPSSSESGLDDSQGSIVEHQPTDPSPSAVGIAEPDPMVRPSGSPAIGDIAAQNLSQRPSAADEDTEESDNNSIYSDAAEDLSDMQGDGFMSLDAVVESPIVPNIPGLAITTPPDSPTTKAFKENPYTKGAFSKESREPEKDEGWGKAQEYWSGLTVEKKKELEQAAREETDESSEEEVIPVPKPKVTKKFVLKSPPTTPQVDQPKIDYFPDRSYQITPGAKAGPHGAAPVMRSSMRVAHPKSEESIHMRSSMRTPPPTTDEPVHMRKSMRDSVSLRASMRGTSEPTAPSIQAKGSLQKKYRPMSVPQPEMKPSPVGVKKHIKSMSASSTSAAPVTKPTPTLRRKGSADSESSFKRARPATEGYSMKRSMRGPQPQQAFAGPQARELPASTVRSSRFSLRSLSPSGSVKRDAPTVGLGRTFRNNRGFSADSNGPTLRSPPPDNTKSRFPGFGKSKPQPKVKVAPTRASRFADSSDEEDARPTFRSRFVDSDDEEDDIVRVPAATRAPIALGSTTRRADNVDDDSSDLPDTDDEKPSKPLKITKVVVPPARTATPTHAGTALASGSLRHSGSGRNFMSATTTTSITAGPVARPNHTRRGSFMSSILRRKKPDPASKVQKIEGESGARRDTPLERTRADLKAVRQDSNFSTASGVTNPRLQKRGTAKRTGTVGTLEDWPLASPHPDTNGIGPDDERPHISDGPEVGEKQLENGTGGPDSAKPDLGPRRTTAIGLAAVDLTTVLPPKKKKKFGMLRRAFGFDG
jgi:serine/arginine repetitive matrix protein 2